MCDSSSAWRTLFTTADKLFRQHLERLILQFEPHAALA